MKQLLTAIIVCISIAGKAQIFYKADSTKHTPIIQYGAGGYIGMNSFAFKHGDKMQNSAGSDCGALLKTILNVSRSVTISIDARYLQKNGIINYRHEMPDIFIVQMSGIQVPLMVSYHFMNKRKKEILNIALGAAYSNIHINTTYRERVGPPIVTNIERENSVRSISENLSGIFAVSKIFNLNKKLNLIIFGEYETLISQLNIQKLTKSQIDYSTLGGNRFRTNSIRLGTYLAFYL